MTLPASIRVNCRSPFPSRVSAGPGLAVAKANGIWNIGLDYVDLVSAASILSTHEWPVYDTVSKTFSNVTFSQLVVSILSGQRVAVNDADYAAAVSAGVIAYTAITAARTVSLPQAGNYAVGSQVLIVDESGSCSATNTITAAASGTDKISGSTTQVLTTAYGSLRLMTDGVSKWTVI